jgi:hypothetical protein
MSRLLLNAFAATQQEYRDNDGAVNDLAAGFRYHNHVLIQLASVIRAHVPMVLYSNSARK